MKNKWSEQIKDLTDKDLIGQLYFTQILLLIISFGLSKIFSTGFSFLKEMNWIDSRIVTIGITSGIIVFLIDFLFMRFLPSSYYDDGGLNEKIFRNQSLLHIFFLTLLVAFSEEMLFRGMIQTKLGLIWASLIFASIHYRYLFHWFLFINVVVLSFFIGFVFDWTNNLAVTIAMHFIIDFLLGVQIKIKWKNSIKKKEQEGTFNE